MVNPTKIAHFLIHQRVTNLSKSGVFVHHLTIFFNLVPKSSLLFVLDTDRLTHCPYFSLSLSLSPSFRGRPFLVDCFFSEQVTINAIENSASVASLVLTTECLISEIPVELSQDQQRAQYDAMGGGDYM